MKKITFKNLSETDKFQFTNHGDATICLEPGEVREVALEDIKGPYDKDFLDAFYAGYADYMEVTVDLEGEASAEDQTGDATD